MGLNYDDDTYEVARGDDHEINFIIAKDDVIQNITGWSIRFTGRLEKPAGTITDDSDAILAYAIGDGVTITSGPGGTVSVGIDGTDTYALPVADTTIFWDLQVTDGAGKTNTAMTGKIVVKPEITRATT